MDDSLPSYGKEKMDRKKFLKSLALLPLAGAHKKLSAMDLKDLDKITSGFGSSQRMPVLFVGHGNPMNALGDNAFSKGWANIAAKLPPPAAVLCVSAHWLTRGTAVAMSPKPKTIHDFGGFPDALYQVQYPAPGSPGFAEMTVKTVKSAKIEEDHEWGLDHGAWSVLKHMYPKADVPVFQLSIDYHKPPRYHYELAKELSVLRSKGVLILASGNVVHNLGMVSWDNSNKQFDWAKEFDHIVKKSIESGDYETLISYQKLGELANMAHPTNDHYLPLMYTLGLKDAKDEFSFFNDSFDMGSISMRSVIFG